MRAADRSWVSICSAQSFSCTLLQAIHADVTFMTSSSAMSVLKTSFTDGTLGREAVASASSRALLMFALPRLCKPGQSAFGLRLFSRLYSSS